MGRIRPDTPVSAVIAAAFLLSAGAAWAQTPPHDPPHAPGVEILVPDLDHALIDRLVDDLAHDDWHIRKQAHDTLVEMGPAILPGLEERLAHVETIHLRDAILLAIEQTRQAAAGRGTLIRAAFTSAGTADVLRTLRTQSGMELGISVIDPAQPISARFDGWTWWQSVGWLCRQNDWDLKVDAGGMSIRPAGSNLTLGGPVHLSGPLAVLCRGARYERELTMSRNADSAWPTPNRVGEAAEGAESARHERGTRFLYEFDGYLEPRFVIGSRSFEVIWTEARDDAGNTLLPAGIADISGMGDDLLGPPSPVAPEKGVVGNRSDATWQSGRLMFSAPLVFPGEPGRTLAVAGRLRASVGADLTVYEATTTQITRGIRWRVAGEQVEVRAETGRSPNRWIVVYETLRDPGPATMDVMIAGFLETQLFDQSRRKLRRGTAYRQEGAAGGVIYRMEFIGPEAEGLTIPARLTATLPARLVKLDLPFRFENLPMP